MVTGVLSMRTPWGQDGARGLSRLCSGSSVRLCLRLFLQEVIASWLPVCSSLGRSQGTLLLRLGCGGPSLQSLVTGKLAGGSPGWTSYRTRTSSSAPVFIPSHPDTTQCQGKPCGDLVTLSLSLSFQHPRVVGGQPEG